MAKLTTDQQKLAKAWLHDVFFAGGLLPPGKCARPKGYYLMYNYDGTYRINKAEIIACCKTICEEIRKRDFDFTSVDTALERLSNAEFGPNMQSTAWRNKVTKPASMLAKYLAWFCFANDIKWDNGNRTSFEIEHDMSTTIGSALAEYKLFTSQSAARTRAASAPSTGGASTGSAPTSGYKSTGGHSKDIPNLIGTPGDKVSGSGSYMFCITANKIGQNTPSAYITPLRVSGSSVITVAKSQAMTVKFGSANGYTDCTLWFDDQTKAAEALEKCEKLFGSKYTGFSLAKKGNSKDYFKVETDLGEAFIKAGKLNEELENNLKNKPQVAKYGTLDEEAYLKYDI